MTLRSTILICLLAIVVFSCKKEADSPAPTAQAKEVRTSPKLAEMEMLPSLTQEEAQKLFTSVDQIDVLFHELGVSLSQSQTNEAKAQVSFLAPGQAPVKPPCKADANIIYQGSGEILADGQMYLDPRCRCVIFYEDGKATKSAILTDQALNFYKQILGGEVQ